VKAAAEALEIVPHAGPLHATVVVPGSKSLTNRALAIAALADGQVTIEGALESDDTRRMVEALGALGFAVRWDRGARRIEVEGRGGEIPARSATLDGGNAGTAVRFLTSLVALGRGEFRIDGDARMRERPIADLLEGLALLGVDARSERSNGCPPVVVRAAGLPGGEAEIAGSVSSQFTSSILLAAPYARSDLVLRLRGALVGAPFVEMTIGMMARSGVRVERDEAALTVRAGQRYRAGTIVIEPDATAASYFLAAAALLGGEVTVPGLSEDSLQGDLHFVDVLRAMGARVSFDSRGVTVAADGRLHGVDVDFRPISDTFLTAAAIAPFADGPTRIRGIAHTRHQETDRPRAVATELRRLGVPVTETEDELRIEPASLRGADVETYGDHRVAMAFALVGLRVPGVRILDPECVAKTFPGYFAALERMLERGTSS
jgi:3-phosphoshikimate 1-carboxyvinyltransferase